MKATAIAGATAILALVLAMPSPAQPLLDQSFTEPWNLGSEINACCAFVGQTYTAGATGMLAGVSIDVEGRSSLPLHVAIRTAEEDLPTMTVLGEVTLGSSSSRLSDLIAFPKPIPQVAGLKYAIVVDYPNAQPQVSQGIWSGASEDAYPRGDMVDSLDGGISWVRFGPSNYDLHFRTFVIPPGAPDVLPLDLGTLGGDYSQPFDVNAAGQVVGHSTTANGEYHAFLWTKDGGMADLGTLGGASSSARALNDRGQVVGYSSIENGQVHAFLWAHDTGMVDLGTLGGSFSWAYDVNGSGQVVGEGTTADNATHGFLWTKDGGMFDLHPPGNNYARAEAINDDGQVVGVGGAQPRSPAHAFLWTRNDGFIDLGALGGTSSVPTDLNASGQVVGYSTTGSNAWHAFTWTKEGGLVDLNPLGSIRSVARALNDSGQVVGEFAAGPSSTRAFSWTRESGMLDLSTLGGSSAQALDVNGNGLVVGYSDTAGSSPLAETHAFAWMRDGGLIDIGNLSGVLSCATKVNDKDQAIGYGRASFSSPSFHALLWELCGIGDRTPPTISEASASPGVLWPPNHRMVDVAVDYRAADNCTAAPACALRVSSNESSPSPQWQVVDPQHVQLLAERSGHNGGRTYTITVTCTDEAGNNSSRVTTVQVPHDQRLPR